MQLRILLLIILLMTGLRQASGQKLFNSERNTLAEKWDLYDIETSGRGLFTIKQYKPVYLLPIKVTNDVNQFPRSPSPEHTFEENRGLNKAETKFQLSFKTKIFNDVFGHKTGGDLWLTFTQISYWQLYNSDISRPFRETNYEPEILLILPVNYRFLGMQSAFIGIGVNHQSNGRSNPLSRSWNRIMVPLAWEGKHSTVIFKPWFRLPESSDVDDNPDMENYMGRGELLYAFGKGRHHISCIGRHTFRFGDNNRGSLEVDYAFRIWDNLKLHAQFFTGYGESMIDYNHNQTCLGLGISLTEWR